MKQIKRIGSLILCIITMLSTIIVFSEPTQAAVKSVTDASEIKQVLAAIGEQNFSGSGISAETAKTVIQHFISSSKWKPGGVDFPYPNPQKNKNESYIGTINDGSYSVEINRNCAGCYAYAEFVYGSVYGTISSYKRVGEQKHDASSLKSLLQTYGRAGAHLRIPGTPHSLVFISSLNTGFYVLDYGGNNSAGSGGPIRFRYWTYDDFIKNYGKVTMFLYSRTDAKNNSIDSGTNDTDIAPSLPTNLNAVKAGEKTAKISWSAGKNATSYEVQYETHDNTPVWKTDPDFKSKTSTSYTTTGLGLYDSYRFRVRSVNSVGKSDWVTVTYTKTKTTAGKPSAPTGLTVTKASSTTAKISWNAVPGASSYEVEYKSPNTNGSWKTDSEYKSKTATSYTVTQLGNNTYGFRVRAVNALGKSNWLSIAYVHLKS